MLRARFRVDEKTEMDRGRDASGQYRGGFRVKLSAVYVSPDDANQPDAAEIAEFFEATPSGQLVMEVVAPAAAEQLKVGRDYYLDFSPVPE